MSITENRLPEKTGGGKFMISRWEEYSAAADDCKLRCGLELPGGLWEGERVAEQDVVLPKRQECIAGF